MSRKNVEMQNTARKISENGQSFAQFSDSVLDAARQQAENILAEAKVQADEKYATIVGVQRTDPLESYRAEARAKLERELAAARQENRKKLLGYRGQLVNSLFAEVEENLAAYVETPAYVEWVVNIVRAHVNADPENCVIGVRAGDEDRLRPALEKAIPGCCIQQDRNIRFGGVKVRKGRLLFDETLDDAIRTQRTKFLGRCGLRVE
ncbi:V-type ATP synthase subunit E [uncultured Ruthenibacterium sp.]|uniref:V-type ATP synthase subunit E n=1 Tax=uncultured Ruthenibacterium sp. TaxID=1905347 RepID=UPI00349E9604